MYFLFETFFHSVLNYLNWKLLKKRWRDMRWQLSLMLRIHGDTDTWQSQRHQHDPAIRSQAQSLMHWACSVCRRVSKDLSVELTMCPMNALEPISNSSYLSNSILNCQSNRISIPTLSTLCMLADRWCIHHLPPPPSRQRRVALR